MQAETRGSLEKRRWEMESAATLLKLEVENEMRMGFRSSSLSSQEPLEDSEASSEVQGSLCESGNFEETGLFAPAADKRLLSLEEKLDFSKIFLTVKSFPEELLPVPQLGRAELVPLAETLSPECAFVSKRMNSGEERLSEKSCSITKTG